MESRHNWDSYFAGTTLLSATMGIADPALLLRNPDDCPVSLSLRE